VTSAAMNEIALDERSSRLLAALYSEFPRMVTAKQLMEHIGLSWRADPVGSFVCFCNDLISVQRAIRPTGWCVERTGGTPDHFYLLSPVGSV
jgi:hypothetical protein